MKSVIVDLDGTLSNCDHRLHHLKREKPDWDQFFDECDGDAPNPWCVALISSMLAAGYHVYVVSARSRIVEEKTLAWFLKHVPAFDHPNLHVYLVRPIGDSTPDQELKRAWLNGFAHRDEIAFVVDDRQKVVDMWRQEGLVCLQCYSWPEFKAKAPAPSEDLVTI